MIVSPNVFTPHALKDISSPARGHNDGDYAAGPSLMDGYQGGGSNSADEESDLDRPIRRMVEGYQAGGSNSAGEGSVGPPQRPPPQTGLPKDGTLIRTDEHRREYRDYMRRNHPEYDERKIAALTMHLERQEGLGSKLSYTELTKDVSYRWTHNKTMKDDYDMKLAKAMIASRFTVANLDFECKQVLLKYEAGRLDQPTRRMIEEANNYHKRDAPTFLGRDKNQVRDTSGRVEGDGLGKTRESVDKSGTEDVDATGRGDAAESNVGSRGGERNDNGGGEQGQGADVHEDDDGGDPGRGNGKGGGKRSNRVECERTMEGGSKDGVMTGRVSKRNNRVECEMIMVLSKEGVMTRRVSKRNNRVEKKVIAVRRTGGHE